MKEKLDLQGKKFGKLTAISSRSGGRKYGVLWKCICECGNEVEVAASALKSGNNKSCGCLQYENLSGGKYGCLTVIEKITCQGRSKYKCECDCGQQCERYGSELKYNGDKNYCSSGCVFLRKLKYGESNCNRIYDTYQRNAKKRNLEFVLTKDDFYELSQQRCYYCSSDPLNVSSSPRSYGEFIYNGIDRVNNEIGYTVENCVSCCKICNIAKNTMTIEQFESWIKSVYATFLKKGH